MPSVVTFGEAMVLFSPQENGPLRHVESFRKYVAGAEANTAIGLVRLGESVGWVSRVGDDEFGATILSALRAEGVDVSRVIVDPTAPTAVFFKERRGLGETRVYYYRQGSAASRMAPADLDPAYVVGARILYLTGITPALSESCRQLAHAAVTMAKQAGVPVAFDPNIRRKLLGDRVQAVLLPLLRASDIALLGLEEARLLLDEAVPGAPGRPMPAGTPDEAETLARAVRELGPQTVLLKLGEAGALALTDAGVLRVPAFRVQVVDAVGAGDGFSAGFLAGWLKGWDLEQSVRLGNLVGTCACTTAGDYAGYPTLREACSYLGLSPDIVAR